MMDHLLFLKNLTYLSLQNTDNKSFHYSCSKSIKNTLVNNTRLSDINGDIISHEQYI